MFTLLKKQTLRVLLALILLVSLPGCSTLPQGAGFPMPPAKLMIPPTDDNLILLPEDRIVTLSEIVDSAKNNYADRAAIKINLEELQEWIRKQAQVYK